MTALLPAMAGANLIYGLGMMESGMTMNFGQLVSDNEIAKMVKRVLQGIQVNDETLAVDVIHKVGAKGHFLSQKHTMKHVRTEHIYPKLIDRDFRGKWEDKGSKTMSQLAEEEARYIIENHKPEPLPEDVKKELSEIIKEAEMELKGKAS